jgi:hypothetical protein
MVGLPLMTDENQAAFNFTNPDAVMREVTIADNAVVGADRAADFAGREFERVRVERNVLLRRFRESRPLFLATVMTAVGTVALVAFGAVQLGWL